MKAEKQRFPPPHALRLFSRDVGGGSVCEEFQFESYGERLKFWADWRADPGTAATQDRYTALADRVLTNDLRTLEE